MPLGIPKVMVAITACQATLASKMDEVQLDIGLIYQDLEKIHSRYTTTEQRVSHMEDTVVEHTTSIQSLQTKIGAPEYRAEDAENHSRQNNLRIVELPEGAEVTNLTVFVEELLQSLLPTAMLSSYFTVDQGSPCVTYAWPRGISTPHVHPVAAEF